MDDYGNEVHLGPVSLVDDYGYDIRAPGWRAWREEDWLAARARLAAAGTAVP